MTASSRGPDATRPAHAQPRSAAEQARFEAALRQMFEHSITFNQTLGVRIDSFDPQAPRLRFAMTPELVGHFQYSRLHGGVTTAVLDAAAGLAIMLATGARHAGESAEQILARFARMGTIDIRVDFIEQGIGQEFFASARVTRLGRRIASTQMSLTNEKGALIATGAAAFIVD